MGEFKLKKIRSLLFEIRRKKRVDENLNKSTITNFKDKIEGDMVGVNINNIQDRLAVKLYNPQFTPLTQEERDDIHARGKITQEEKVKEWEGLDLCAPGDNFGSASHRCKKFQYRCHDCLVDYSLQNIEYDSFYDSLKNKEEDVVKKKVRKKS